MIAYLKLKARGKVTEILMEQRLYTEEEIRLGLILLQEAESVGTDKRLKNKTTKKR